MAKVRRFDVSIPDKPADKPEPSNRVADIPRAAADSLTASAPLQTKRKPGNPRPRRYRQKTYSLIEEDIARLESLVAEVRQAGAYDRSRSDVVRAALLLFWEQPIIEKLRVLEQIENLKG